MSVIDVRRMSGVFVLVILAFTSASSLFAEVPQQAKQNSKQPPPIQSRKVEVRGRFYQLRWLNEHLFLESTDLEGDGLHKQQIAFIDRNEFQVSDCALSPWLTSRGLVAIVRVRQGEKFQFLCFVSARTEPVKLQTPEGEQEQKVINLEGYMNGFIYETTEDWRVLSLDGNQSGDSFCAVIGEFNEDPSWEEGTESSLVSNNLLKGVVIYNGCPAPPVNVGATPLGQK